jgi:hypothetical protein
MTEKALLDMYADWRRNQDYADVRFEPEYFLAWIEVVAQREGFDDIESAREIYRTHKANGVNALTLTARRVELEAIIPKELAPGWHLQDRKEVQA